MKTNDWNEISARTILRSNSYGVVWTTVTFVGCIITVVILNYDGKFDQLSFWKQTVCIVATCTILVDTIVLGCILGIYTLDDTTHWMFRVIELFTRSILPWIAFAYVLVFVCKGDWVIQDPRQDVLVMPLLTLFCVGFVAMRFGERWISRIRTQIYPE